MTKAASSYMNGKTMAAGTLGLLVASSIGAALGVLFAPKAGSETRSDLAEKAKTMAKRFKRSRAEVEAAVKDAFGTVSDELAQSYLEIKGEIMARMEDLASSAKTKTAYNHIVKSAIETVSKGKDWTKAQIDKLTKNLDDEYEGPSKTDEA